MNGRTGLMAAVVATLLAGSGCVCCGNKSYGLAHTAAADCEVPACQRNQVYLFALGGINPAEVVALADLREQLGRQGFAKVATGQVVHEGWAAREMRRIQADEPDAVFVLLGSESGCASAVRLAERATARGVPVAAVVLLDASGKTPAPTNGVRTLTVGAGYGVASSSNVASVSVPDSGRFTLACNPRTVAAVTQLLQEVALTTPGAQAETVTQWSYPHAPEVRPTFEPGADTEWAFLFPQSGTPRAIGDAAPVLAARPAPAAAVPGNVAARK